MPIGQTKRRIAVVAVVALVALSGCSSVLGGGSGGVTIATEDTDRGEYLYVQSSGGELPAGTTINVSLTFTARGEQQTIGSEGTINESVPAGTKVYVGGEPKGDDGLGYVIGERPDGAGVNGSEFNQEVTVTVTVDTGESTTTEEFTYGG